MHFYSILYLFYVNHFIYKPHVNMMVLSDQKIGVGINVFIATIT